MQVSPGDTRVWRLVPRCTGEVWRKREPLSLRGHRRARAMARDCATACTPKQGLFGKPWGLPRLSSVFPSLPSLWAVLGWSCLFTDEDG